MSRTAAFNTSSRTHLSSVTLENNIFFENCMASSTTSRSCYDLDILEESDKTIIVGEKDIKLLKWQTARLALAKPYTLTLESHPDNQIYLSEALFSWASQRYVFLSDLLFELLIITLAMIHVTADNVHNDFVAISTAQIGHFSQTLLFLLSDNFLWKKQEKIMVFITNQLCLDDGGKTL